MRIEVMVFSDVEEVGACRWLTMHYLGPAIRPARGRDVRRCWAV